VKFRLAKKLITKIISNSVAVPEQEINSEAKTAGYSGLNYMLTFLHNKTWAET